MTQLTKEEYAARIAAYEQRCRDMIAESGHMLQGVFPTEYDEDQTWFMYTIGRQLQQKFDFITTGRGGEHVLNDIAAMIDNNEIAFAGPGESEPFTVEGALVQINDEPVPLRCKIKQCKNVAAVVDKYACGTSNLRIGVTFPVGIYQVFMADKNNVLLGELSYDTGYHQPDVTNLGN